jgi:hypothetical protein
MLEVTAMTLFVLWMIGLITGNVFSGAIHVLLVTGLVAAYFHHRAAAEERARALMISSRSIAGAMGVSPKGSRPVVPKKSGPGTSTRPSAAA